MHIRFFAGVIFILGMQFSIQAQSTEWIKAYFNMPAVTEKGSFLDQSINDGFDLIGTLETLIDSATTSIDLCIYDLEHPRIGEALVRAKKEDYELGW